MANPSIRSRLINLSATHEMNHVNGPGCRFVLWVQGCHLGCAECWNKHTWSFKKRNMVSADDIFQKISNTKNLDGVTFTGGEPFLQPRPLAYLAKRIKSELNLNLQIFTGFEMSELNGRAQQELLALTDVVVCGRYNPSLPNNNQKTYEFSGVKWRFDNSSVQIDISTDGSMLLTGYPSDKLIKEIQGEST